MYMFLLYLLALPSENIASKDTLKGEEGEDREGHTAHNYLKPEETHFTSTHNSLARPHSYGPP